MKTQESLHFSLHFGKKNKKTTNKIFGLRNSLKLRPPQPQPQVLNLRLRKKEVRHKKKPLEQKKKEGEKGKKVKRKKKKTKTKTGKEKEKREEKERKKKKKEKRKRKKKTMQRKRKVERGFLQQFVHLFRSKYLLGRQFVANMGEKDQRQKEQKVVMHSLRIGSDISTTTCKSRDCCIVSLHTFNHSVTQYCENRNSQKYSIYIP